jgi:hypothetical protein
MFACGAAPDYAGGYGLAKWAWGRDSVPALSAYAQPFYATLFVYYGVPTGLIYPDAVCTGGTVHVQGNRMLTVDIKAASITTPTAWTPTAEIEAPPASFDLNPYLCKETLLNISIGAGGADAFVTTKDHSFDWDNMVASPADMFTVGSGAGALALPSAARAQWKGQFSRFFSRDGSAYAAGAFWNAFMADTECGMLVSLARPAYSATASLTFPRISLGDVDIPLPRDGFVEETVQWQALGTPAGAAAMTFAESMGAYGS